MNPTKRLLVVLASGSLADRGPAKLAFRYAMTAAALDLNVEIHVVGESVSLLKRRQVELADEVERVSDDSPKANTGGDRNAVPAFSARDFLSQLRDMKAMDVKLYACSAALSDAGLTVADLIPEVDGVRGAAALLAAGVADDTRLLSF